MAGVRLLQKHQVELNALACVGRDTAYRPLDVYRFFKDAGIHYIQFNAHRRAHARPGDGKCSGCGSPRRQRSIRKETHTEVTPWTVEPEAYGDFLIAIYEEWVRKDVGTTFVMNFEWALTAGWASLRRCASSRGSAAAPWRWSTTAAPPRCISRTGSMMSEMMTPSTLPVPRGPPGAALSLSTKIVMSRVLYSSRTRRA